MTDEQLRVLVVRAVIGVGVDDQLRIRDVLLHDERVDRGHDHVVTAVHDEGWLLDRFQIVVRPLLLDAPLAHCCNLGGRNLVVHLGIAPLLTKMLALQESRACSAISCATMPPIEKPRTSALFKRSARLKATALALICSNVVGTSPELLETPALLNKITSRSRAKPSVTAGSQ